MIANPVMRDERTESVENSSYRWAYLVLSYGLLLSVIYRGFITHESSWDLLALVILGGGVATAYQGTQNVLSSRWRVISFAAVVIAAVIGGLIALGH